MKTNIKKLLSLMLAMLIAISCFSLNVSAADAKAVLEFSLSDDGYAVVTDCDSSAKGVLSVPDKATVDGESYSVRYIGDRAFDKCKYLTEIKIPEGVTAIGSAAFRNCVKLEEVYIPESLIRCEFDAFDGCSEVVVHCYTANYQFIMLCGTYSDIVLDVVDEQEGSDEESTETDEDNLEDLGFIGNFIMALRNLIENILDYFGVEEEDDFTFEDLPLDLPFELPFDIEQVL